MIDVNRLLTTFAGMTTYAMVLEEEPVGRSFASSDDARAVVRAHAIRWPDPDGRSDWRDVRTLCGRRTHDLKFEELPDPTDWWSTRYVSIACTTCRDRSRE
ncbi:hypothetical protein ACWEQA_12975 [Nocardia sp. NPDC004085]